MSSTISDYIKGLDKLWVLRDNFGFKSFNKHYYLNQDYDKYMLDSFEVSGFNVDCDSSFDVNAISRLRNNLVAAIRDQIVLPKYILVVLDNDIIHFAKVAIDFNLSSCDISAVYVSLRLRMQNRRRKWHFPPNFQNDII